MGSRTSSQLDFRNSQSDFTTTPVSLTGRLDPDSIRNSTKSLAAALDLETRLQQQQQQQQGPAEAARTASVSRTFTPSSQREIPPVKASPPAVAAAPAMLLKTTTPAQRPVPAVAADYGKLALDANQNATPATLPSGAPQQTKTRLRQPDPMVEMFPKESVA